MRFKDRTIGLLVAPGFDDYQVFCLASKLRERGASVSLIAVGEDARTAVYGNSGSMLKPDTTLERITSRDIDAVIIPSRTSQEDLTGDEGVMTLVLGLDSEGKPIGSVGNGVMVIAAAGLLAGRRIASPDSGSESLEEHEVRQIDQELVVDRNIVTARSAEGLDHIVDVIAFLLEPAPSYS
ncbi:MAG: hypothetical protein C4534_04695 [Gaiellales bacterium]|nr:MAG: hypothetical protein C4534_04695 [Gaiellales bacterium]